LVGVTGFEPATGDDESASAPHLWRGRPVRFELRRLADDDLLRLPMSGPPKLLPRGALRC